MHVSIWVSLLTALVFGCASYLVLQLAAILYGNVQPFSDGPKPIAVNPLVPASCAAVFGAIFVTRPESLPQLAVAAIVIAALCAVVWTDLTRGIVGDWFTLPPLAIVLVAAALRGDIVPIAIALALVTFPFAAAALFSKGRGFGWGDVKLVALGAALLDPQISILLYAVCCMVACAITMVRRKGKEPIAFAPYLAASIAIGLLLPVTHQVAS